MSWQPYCLSVVAAYCCLLSWQLTAAGFHGSSPLPVVMAAHYCLLSWQLTAACCHGSSPLPVVVAAHCCLW